MPRNERLLQQRILRNWRQQDVADRLGTTAITVLRWEQGKQQPGAYYRAKLCELFGLNSQELGLVEASLSFFHPESPLETETYPQTGPSDQLMLWMVPYIRNPYFTGREEILNQLMSLHAPKASDKQSITINHTALTQAKAVKGLGGIGKTQIAVEYAYRALEQHPYTHVLWITAANEETILASYSAFADLLPDGSIPRGTDQHKRVAASIRWLEQCEQPWLLIVDNADDLSLVQPYLPTRGYGCILLTTRANAVGSLTSSIEVNILEINESIQLLLRRAKLLHHTSDEDIEETQKLAVLLGQFPLALDQAGAYMEETGCTISMYLQLYQEYRQPLLARRGQQATGYPDSVASTWSLSFQQVEQTNPAAAELLQLCTFLAPDHIPEELLILGAPYWPERLQQAVRDPIRFNAMLETLLSFSLIKRFSTDHMLSIHRLVQATQLERLSPHDQHQWAERFIQALQSVFPPDPEEDITTWPQCQRYLEQVQACNQLIQDYQLLLPAAAKLLDAAGIYLSECALFTPAELFYQQAIYIWEQQEQAEPAILASPLSNLASLYILLAKYKDAEELYLRSLHISKKSADPDPVLFALALTRLALLYYLQGRNADAEPLYAQALQIWEHQVGAEPIGADLGGCKGAAAPLLGCGVSPRKNLFSSFTHPQGGDMGSAEGTPLPKSAHMEEKPPGMTWTLFGLGLIYHKQGKYAESESFFLRALHIREQQKILHPQIAYVLQGLANLYYQQERYTEAEAAFQRALHIRLQQFGPEHPSISPLYSYLALLYFKQERYEQVEDLFQRSLNIQEQSMGRDHLNTAHPLTGLGRFYTHQGHYEEAETLLLRALHIREQHLEPQHPDMADLLSELAHLYHLQGRDTEAEELFQRSLNSS